MSDIVSSPLPIRVLIQLEDFDLKSLKPNLEVDAIFDVPVDIFLSNQYYDPFKFQYRGTGQYIDIPRFNWKLSNGETVTMFGITAFICTHSQ